MRSEAVEQLLHAHGRELLRFAYQLTHDRAAAEDLVQESVSRMLRYKSKEKIQVPVAYARMIIIRLYQDSIRKDATRQESLVPSFDPSHVTVPAQTKIVDDREVLWAALGRLDIRSRTVLVLRFYADLTDAQMADYLNCPKGTVRSTLSRALSELRAHINRNEE